MPWLPFVWICRAVFGVTVTMFDPVNGKAMARKFDAADGRAFIPICELISSSTTLTCLGLPVVRSQFVASPAFFSAAQIQT
jgi:hypothetical protein